MISWISWLDRCRARIHLQPPLLQRLEHRKRCRLHSPLNCEQIQPTSKFAPYRFKATVVAGNGLAVAGTAKDGGNRIPKLDAGGALNFAPHLSGNHLHEKQEDLSFFIDAFVQLEDIPSEVHKTSYVTLEIIGIPSEPIVGGIPTINHMSIDEGRKQNSSIGSSTLCPKEASRSKKEASVRH